MRVARALLRRSLVQSGQLAAALAIATVGCAALLVLLVVPAAGIDRGVATLLADAEPTAGALRVETALADDSTAQDAEFAEAFRSQVLAPKIAASRAIYERARERGEIRDDVDIDLVAPMLAGIVLHRVLVLGEPPSTDLVERVIDQIVLPAVRPPSPMRP